MKDSRFQYRERPNLSPGSCAVCKGHGPVIDYMVNVPILGRLYICLGCIDGAVSNIPLSAEKQEEVDKQERIDELEAEIAGLNGTLDSVRSLLDNWSNYSDSLSDSTNSPPVGSKQKSAGKDSGSTGKNAKSSSKQDAARVPGDSVDDLFL